MHAAFPVLLATALQPELRVLAHEERSIDAEIEVAHARADGGTVLGWSGRSVRWRAPPVCATATVALTFQARDGAEKTQMVRVDPRGDEPLSALAIVGVGDGWEVQSASAEPLEFAVGEGTLAPLPESGLCQRRRWTLAPTRRPDLAVAVAFSGSELHAWSVLGRSGRAAVRVERARPGSVVGVLVEGRFFPATADELRKARVIIEVPPGVEWATAVGGGKSVRVPLNPPPLRTDHGVGTPDGTRWLFLTDAAGRPRDGPPVDGAMRVEVGAYRFPPLARSAPRARLRSSDVPTATPQGSGTPSLASRAAAERASPTPEDPWIWRVAAGGMTGPSFEPGVGIRLDRSLWRALSFDLSIGMLVTASGSRHAVLSSGTDSRRMVGGTAVFGEMAWTRTGPSWRLRVPLGIGAAVGWRRAWIESQPPLDSVDLGPLATSALEVGRSQIDLEIRAIWGEARLGLDTSRWLWLAGVGWRWGR